MKIDLMAFVFLKVCILISLFLHNRFVKFMLFVTAYKFIYEFIYEFMNLYCIQRDSKLLMLITFFQLSPQLEI